MAKRKSVEGKDLMLFLDGKTIALATSCTLNVSRNMDEASSKDDGSWRTVTPGDAQWDLSTDSLFSADEKDDKSKQIGFAEIFAALVEGQELSAHFTIVENKSSSGLPDSGWLPKAGGYTGKCYVNSASISAAKGSAASNSISFTGNGPLQVNQTQAEAANEQGEQTAE
jgi:hypothetical protein